MHGLTQHVRVMRIVNSSGAAPPRFVEYAYYVVIAYGLFGVAWGLTVPLLGAGSLALLAAFCVMRLGSRAATVYRPIVFPLACAISFVALQLTVHGESLMGSDARPFVTWMLALIVVQSLALRQEFLHRFAVTAFVIGLSSLPYITYYVDSGALDRIGISEETGLANPNVLGMWFGFCSVYFIVLGIESRSNVVRLFSWLAALGSLFIVGITVSRGPLLAVAIACTFASRRVLRRGFVPVLVLFTLSWIVYASGLFEDIAAFYISRGAEESGRGLILPIAIERFLSSPLAGVGVSDVKAYVPGTFYPITPHNGFLYIALSSGVFPLVFLLAYWIRGAWSAFRANIKQLPDAPFQIPLFIFAFLETMLLDFAFMDVWTIVVLSTLMGSATHQVRHILVRQTGRGKTEVHSEDQDEAKYAIARYQLRGRPLRS